MMLVHPGSLTVHDGDGIHHVVADHDRTAQGRSGLLQEIAALEARVTQLQARGSELVLERQASAARHRDLELLAASLRRDNDRLRIALEDRRVSREDEDELRICKFSEVDGSP